MASSMHVCDHASHRASSVCKDGRLSEVGTPNGDSLLSTWSTSASWQLLTGHANGRLLLWDIGGDGITPLVHIDGAQLTGVDWR